MDRFKQLQRYLIEVMPESIEGLTSLAGDASFRRYFRFACAGKNYIAVDAPPEKENNEAFVQIGQRLAAANIIVPTFYHVNLTHGFLVLSDLGDKLLFQEIASANINELMISAIDCIEKIQCSEPAFSNYDLPRFDSDFMNGECSWFKTWLVEGYCGKRFSSTEEQTLQQCIELLLVEAVEQPQVVIHRDFHSRNLMVLEDNQLAVIDFQDAMIGPITYDIVSLLRDCYVTWSNADIDAWLSYFQQQCLPEVEFSLFRRWFDWIGLQRHLKVAGIFARLALRDGKMDYLKELPRVLTYIEQIAGSYSELSFLAEQAMQIRTIVINKQSEITL